MSKKKVAVAACAALLLASPLAADDLGRIVGFCCGKVEVFIEPDATAGTETSTRGLAMPLPVVKEDEEAGRVAFMLDGQRRWVSADQVRVMRVQGTARACPEGQVAVQKAAPRSLPGATSDYECEKRQP